MFGWTGDIVHFVWLNGTDCYVYNEQEPVLFYKSYIIEQIVQDDKDIVKAKFKKQELYWQTTCNTI